MTSNGCSMYEQGHPARCPRADDRFRPKIQAAASNASAKRHAARNTGRWFARLLRHARLRYDYSRRSMYRARTCPEA